MEDQETATKTNSCRFCGSHIFKSASRENLNDIDIKTKLK